MNPSLPPKSATDVDFPIERAEAEHVSRREFAKFLCLVSGGMAVGSGWVAIKDKIFPPFRFAGDFFVCKKSDVPLGGNHAFTIEGAKIPFILIHLKDGSFRAYEQKCTHLSCAVYYSPEHDKIECPCHHGFFDAKTGRVLQGPPPRPLPHLEVVIKGDDIYVREPEVENPGDAEAPGNS
ncbi:MAG: Rieske (2Fe-2S) protein [Terrimicrobiaceae bacterium]|jgi:nitrite reductase/ring-hydroxylating ferredoxin subunit